MGSGDLHQELRDLARTGLHNLSYAPFSPQIRGSSQPAQEQPLAPLRSLTIGLTLLVTLLACSAPASASDESAIALNGPGTDPAVLWGYLQNGCGYAVIENHAAPMVGSVAIVHGGSGNEDWATQGASHFLEHLLFNGTETRTQEEIYSQIDLLGAYNNATTRATHVAYLLVAPKDEFWAAFDVQQDMLFHSILPPDKLEKERGIILEELNRSMDSNAYEVERVLQLDLFGPQGYGMPTLGSPTSIRSLTREQILGFYEAFYVPNRVTWLIIGDVQPFAAIDSLEARVGSIPGRAAPPPPIPSFDHETPLMRVHHLEVESPVLQWSWVLDDPIRRDHLPFQVRFEVMSEGNDSPLGRRCLETWPGAIDGYTAYLTEYPGFAAGTVRLDLNPSADPDQILAEFPAVLAEVQAEPVDPAAVEAWKVRAETGELYIREKPHYYGIMRGEMIAARGLAGLVGYLPAVQALSPTAVAAEAAPLFWPPTRISVVLPRPSAGPGQEPEGTGTGQPGGGAAGFERWSLSNGAEVAALSSPDSPVLAVHLFVRERSRREPAGRAGIAELTHNLLGRATKRRDPGELSLALGRIGAELKTADSPFIPYDDFYTSPQFSFVRFQSLDRYAPEAFTLLSEMLGEPEYLETEFQQAKGAALRRAAQSRGSSRATAQRLLAEFIDPDQRTSDLYGTEESLTPIELSDVQEFSAAYFDPRAFLFVVASSLPLAELRSLTEETLGQIAVPDGPPSVDPLESDNDNEAPTAEILVERIRRRLETSDPDWNRFFAEGTGPGPWARDSLALLADSTGSAQSYVSLVHAFAAPDSLRPALTIANGILSERLAQQLRETEGLAYSIGSALSEQSSGTWVWTPSAGTSPQNLPRMIEGFLEVAPGLMEAPPDPVEVRKTAARIYGRGLMRRATRINWAYYAGSAILDGRDPVSIEDREAALRAVTPEQVLDVVTRYWQAGPRLVVLAY